MKSLFGRWLVLPWPAIAGTCLITLIVLGCGSEREFFEISGKVTLNGKPVEYAEMHIRPISTDIMNSGQTVHVRIIDGKFDTGTMRVAGGPAEWTISAAAPGSVKIRNPEDITPQEDEQFLRAKKEVFVKEIEVNANEINVELP